MVSMYKKLNATSWTCSLSTEATNLNPKFRTTNKSVLQANFFPYFLSNLERVVLVNKIVNILA